MSLNPIDQAYVDAAMRHAVDQGYSFAGWSVSDIALDILAFDAEVCGTPVETLEPLVANWRTRHPEA